MEAALSSDEFRVRQVVPGTRNRNLGNNRYEVDLSSPDALKQFHASITGGESAVGAVINFLGLSGPFARPGCNGDASPLRLAQWVFNVVKEFEGDLRQSAKRGGGWALNFTSLDGKFGLESHGELPVAQAATIGMFKTLRKEWPDVWVKTIDVDRRMEPEVLLTHLGEEIACDDGLIEVGIAGNKRWKIGLVDEPNAAQDLGPLPLDGHSVVLVTGGAYGITADVTRLLARAARPRLVLVGRSPPPAPESPETSGLADTAALRKHLITSMRREDPSVAPAAIERALQRMLKDRQIRRTLAEIEQAGSSVEYHAVDVRDAAGFGAVIDGIYEKYGRLDGVVHGAGVIEDGLVARKTPESFANVFSTKVDSAWVLANKLRPETLKFLVFFSSVSGRFGNLGQVDYAGANDCLNKLAAHLDARWPARVVAINWGPWDAGMVSDELRRLYESHGVHLIPPADGARMFLEEIQRSAGKPEVVVACDVQAIANAGRGDSR